MLCGHDIGEGGRQTTRIDTLRAFCEYAQDPKNGVWVDTVANIGRYVAAHRTAPARPRRLHGLGTVIGFACCLPVSRAFVAYGLQV